MTTLLFLPSSAARLLQLSLLVILISCGDPESEDPSGPGRMPVASVRIAPVADIVLVGSERALQAWPLSATGTELKDRTVTWGSEDQAVATVNQGGVLTALAEGTARISASSEGKTSRIEVRIVAPNPVPQLTALTPSRVPAGSAGPVTVDVTGMGFRAGTRLRLDDVEQVTEHLGAGEATTLRMQLDAARLADVAVLAVTAVSPAPGGGMSNALPLTIEAAPAPVISDLDPRQITAGWAGSFTLTISGNGFTPRSTVSWDGVRRSARFVDATTLHITVDPQDVRVARAVSVQVETPAPGGGRASATFMVHAIAVARVTVQSPAGHAWTWQHLALPLAALAEDQQGRELTDRRASWSVAKPGIAFAAAIGDRDVHVYGLTPGETEVEAVVDGVRASRTVRVHETPAYDLVFEAGEGDDRHLKLWDLSVGNGPRRLATSVAAFSPSPSPDGREIAFVGVEKGQGPTANVDLFVMSRDGQVRRIAPSDAFDSDPAWSPSGTKLAFTSARSSGSLDVFVVDLVSHHVTRLTDASPTRGIPGSGYASRWPTWSPDGSQIAYTVQSATGLQLWVMSATGQNKRQLTDGTEGDDYEPMWSPDGSVIVFAREFRQPRRSLVMTVRPDGSFPSSIGWRVVDVAATPAYSPDGRWLTTSVTRGSGSGPVYAFSVVADAGPRIVMPVALGGGRHARWMLHR